MAFPAPVSITPSQALPATTSVVISLPTITSGQGVLIIGTARGGTSGAKFDSLPSGYNELYDDGSTSAGFAVWHKGDGTESSTVTLTANQSIVQWAADVFLFDSADIEDWDTQPPEASLTTFTSATDPWTQTGTLTPTGGSKDYFWLATAHQNTRTLSLVSYPTNYTDNQTRHESSPGGSACVQNYCSRDYNGTSQSGLVFDWTSSTNATGALGLVVVHPPGGGGGGFQIAWTRNSNWII